MTSNSGPGKTYKRVWQRMLSGRRLNLLDPSPMDIEMEDIAHGLARVARWNGQTRGKHAFSVAQHALVVEKLCRQMKKNPCPSEQLTALLHDAPEYVIGDMISPFKAVLGSGYKDIESRLTRAIHLRFGLPANIAAGLKRRIRKADMMSAWIEATQLAGFSQDESDCLFTRPPDNYCPDLVPQPPETAEADFMARAMVLLSGMDKQA